MKLVISDQPIEERFFFEQPFNSEPKRLLRLYLDKEKKIILDAAWDASTNAWAEVGEVVRSLINGNSDLIETTREMAKEHFPEAMTKLEGASND